MCFSCAFHFSGAFHFSFAFQVLFTFQVLLLLRCAFHVLFTFEVLFTLEVCFSCAFHFSFGFQVLFTFQVLLLLRCAFHVLFTFQVLLLLRCVFHVLFTFQVWFSQMHHIHIHAPPNVCIDYHIHIHAPHVCTVKGTYMCTIYTYMHHQTHVHHQIDLPPKYKIYLVGLPSVLYEKPGPNERSVLNQLFLVLFIFQVKTAMLFMKTTAFHENHNALHENCYFSWKPQRFSLWAFGLSPSIGHSFERPNITFKQS